MPSALVKWPVSSLGRFIVFNAALVGIPFGIGCWLEFENGEVGVEALLISAILGIGFSVSWSLLMWNSFVVRRLRQDSEKHY
jgi:hypothetical protein